MWQAQYSEPPVRVAGAVSRASIAAGRRSLSVWQAQYLEPLDGVAARGVAAGRRSLSVWQAQYPEPLEGVAARGVAAAGAISRGSRRVLARGVAAGRRSLSLRRREGVAARGRRWAPVSVCVAGAVYPEKGLRRAVLPLGAGLCLCGRRSISSL